MTSGGNDPFLHRTLWVASLHGKERALHPLREAFQGLEISVVPGLDTDRFGTFSGEKPRSGTAEEAAREKIMAAIALVPGGDLFVASEGSFGPHPVIPFVQADTELLLLHDRRNNWWIRSWEVDAKVWFHQYPSIASRKHLHDVLDVSGFPGHGLILMALDSEGGLLALEKEAVTAEQIDAAYRRLLALNPASVAAETDLRAHRNPTRMEIIRKTAIRLAGILASRCPQCGAPGFQPVSSVPGLPCESCGMPTRIPRAEIWSCHACTCRDERPVAASAADAMYCDFCNP